MLVVELQYVIGKIQARRFEMPSMLIINNMKKSSIDFKAFIATKTDRIHNIDFNGTLM